MHLATHDDTRPVESVDQLRSYFEAGCKPADKWLLGTEFELLGIHTTDCSRGIAPPYEGENGIRALLDWLIAEREWSPITERDYIIALTRGDTQITFEPGGQFELAARPVVHTDEMRGMLEAFSEHLFQPSQTFGLKWLGLGFRPFSTRDEVPWMPKGRYEIMRAYMPTVGTLGLDMMKRTATVQVNLDFSDERDAYEKLRASMSMTSVLTAMFANSPIVEHKPSGYQSYRAHVWRDTDADRCGLLPFVFDDGDIFSAYTEYALDVPMYFIHLDDYRAAGGITFRQFMRDGFQGHTATMDDWALHLSTLFPEARMKKLIEVRGCDCGPREMVLALGPLCRGLLYDADARKHVLKLTGGLDMNERIALTEDVARDGLRAKLGNTGHTVHDWAKELLAIASDGLERQSPTEMSYLEPLRAIVASGRTHADQVLDLWERSQADDCALIQHASYLNKAD